MATIVLAIVIGAAFGFVLDRVGATNPGYIVKMLNLADLHLMRTILLAIGVSSVLLFGGLLAGLVDPGHLSIKSAYWGVLVGGMLLGAGFAVSGFCPGTGLTAAATGRKDAMFFVLGGLLGAGAYMVSYEWIASTGILEAVAEGPSTLGTIQGTNYPAFIASWSGEITGLAMGLVLITIAFVLPARFRRRAP